MGVSNILINPLICGGACGGPIFYDSIYMGISNILINPLIRGVACGGPSPPKA